MEKYRWILVCSFFAMVFLLLQHYYKDQSVPQHTPRASASAQDVLAAQVSRLQKELPQHMEGITLDSVSLGDHLLKYYYTVHDASSEDLGGIFSEGFYDITKAVLKMEACQFYNNPIMDQVLLSYSYYTNDGSGIATVIISKDDC